MRDIEFDFLGLIYGGIYGRCRCFDENDHKLVEFATNNYESCKEKCCNNFSAIKWEHILGFEATSIIKKKKEECK